MTKENNKPDIIKVINFLTQYTKDFQSTMTEKIINEYGRNPFLILISCLLSLRTRDVITYQVSSNIFKIARTPEQILNIPIDKLEQLIYKTGFYKRKAAILRHVSRELIDRFNSKVPNTEEELLSIKGIGIKTANLVLCMAFSIPAICVDTHVHRLVNQLGWVKTKTAEQSEKELKKIIPKDKWCELNSLLVKWGQNKPKSNIYEFMQNPTLLK